MKRSGGDGDEEAGRTYGEKTGGGESEARRGE